MNTKEGIAWFGLWATGSLGLYINDLGIKMFCFTLMILFHQVICVHRIGE